MPNLHAHIYLAQEAASRLGYRSIDAHLGSFFLGCTTPDIRVMTRGRREETHFSSISSEGLRSGIDGMFAANPSLLDVQNLTEATKVFLCGYVSHLLADQTWIIKMYRPYFGNPKVFDDGVEGNIMDRALQLELDRQGHERTDSFGTAITKLVGSSNGVEIGFIDSKVLFDWQERVSTVIEREFTWERLHFMARRAVADPENSSVTGIVDRFIAGPLSGLDSIYKHIPEKHLEDYKEEVIRSTMDFAEGYLT